LSSGLRADGRPVVGRGRPVGGAHLAQPRAGGLQQLGQPEAIPDLDQLAPADHDLPARGERGRGQHQRCRVVVHHRDGLRRGHRGGERGQGAAAAAAALARREVELHVGAARRGLQRVASGR